MRGPTGSELLDRAHATVREVSDHPEARLRLRRAFYARHASGAGAGHGRGELDFVRWQVDRGLLAPLSEGGSPYWRATQQVLARDAETASLAHRAGVRDLPEGARAWLDWIERPTIASWYRAHNRSLVLGMRASVDAAHAEPELERRFINRALHRVLRAEVLARGGARPGLGWLGRRAADPSGPVIGWLARADGLYPRSYPLTGSLPSRRWRLERALARWALDPLVLEGVAANHLRVLCPEPTALLEALFEAQPIYPREIS